MGLNKKYIWNGEEIEHMSSPVGCHPLCPRCILESHKFAATITKREVRAINSIIDSVEVHMSYIEDKSPYKIDLKHTNKFLKRNNL